MNKQDWVNAAKLNEEWGAVRKTLPGLLADILDRILYDRSDCVRNVPDSSIHIEKLGLPKRVYIGDTESYIKWHGKDGQYADTEKTLREIAELLEAYGYRAMKEKRTR